MNANTELKKYGEAQDQLKAFLKNRLEKEVETHAPWYVLLLRRIAGVAIVDLERYATDQDSRELLSLFIRLESEHKDQYMRSTEAVGKYGLCKSQLNMDIRRGKITMDEYQLDNRVVYVRKETLERLYGKGGKTVPKPGPVPARRK